MLVQDILQSLPVVRRSELGLNAHDAYGYLDQPLLADLIGDWLLPP
jgi:hypothetical protein